MSRSSSALLFGVAPLALLATVSIGCGNECGPNTIEMNGQCIADNGSGSDGGSDITCGPGTMKMGDQCVLVATDGGTDLPRPDGGDMGDVGCTLQASSCGMGTHFNAAKCHCDPDFLPPEIAVDSVQEKVVDGALSGSIVKDGTGLWLYWTRGMAPYGVRKQEIDTATLMLKGMPVDVMELGNNAFGPSASADGLWIAFACVASDHGGMNTATDLCISQRATVNDPWGAPRLMTEMTFSAGPMAAPVPLSSPSFRSGAGGAPVEIFFSAYRHTAEGAGVSICHNTFDAASGMGVPYHENNILCPQGTPCAQNSDCPPLDPMNPMGPTQTCNLDQPTMGMPGTCSACVETVCQRFQDAEAAGQIGISDLANSNAGPAWTPDGQYFAWTKSGSGVGALSMYATQSTDIWVGKSSGMNGTVDSFVGGLSSNSELTEHSISFAPDGSGIVAWSTLVNPNNPADGSWLNLGKITSFTPAQ